MARARRNNPADRKMESPPPFTPGGRASWTARSIDVWWRLSKVQGSARRSPNPIDQAESESEPGERIIIHHPRQSMSAQLMLREGRTMAWGRGGGAHGGVGLRYCGCQTHILSERNKCSDVTKLSGGV